MLNWESSTDPCGDTESPISPGKLVIDLVLSGFSFTNALLL